MSYIDLHAHVLPGVDDGAETLEASLMMLRMASEHGTKALAVTPHGAGVTKTQYLGKFERLKAVAARERLPVKLFFGMEMMADGTLFDRLQSGDVQPLGESRFLLVEFDPLDSSEWCAAATEHIRKYGYVPLIAHPERYVILQNEPWRAELWTERGAALQVTRSGIFGAFGRRAAETARVLLERDLAFCVASDGHGAAYRRPILEDVNAWLTEHFGAAYAERMLHENPRRILSGEARKGENRMRVFQMVMAVLFCAALTFYLWVAVPRVQAQDTSMPVLTDETDGELALSVTAPESAYCAGLHAEDAQDGDLTDVICIADMVRVVGRRRRRIKYVVSMRTATRRRSRARCGIRITTRRALR